MGGGVVVSYQALYRAWRPQSFGDVSGQKVITQTLKNAIKQGNVSHAYLFSGPRGTGKTSVAKIFAKAINCPYAKDGEPCNECHLCTEITKGALGDVIEIDAASNNGVEEIRDIREKVQYAPTQAIYKVYIIDEVHMLSTGAFNALLKTLEEPPKNVIFILATTEPHKIPLTILSRTQRFDFKRIEPKDIIERLTYILSEKNIDYEPDALLIIANAAEGGMRDALSMLDQALSFMDKKLMVKDALQITGSITQSLLLEYVQAILTQQTEQGLEILSRVLAEGKDVARFIEDTILVTRDMLLYKQAGKSMSPKLAKIDDQFIQLTDSLPALKAYEIIQVFNDTAQELRHSNHADVYLEVATVKLAQKGQLSHQVSQDSDVDRHTNEDVNGLRQKIKKLEEKMSTLSAHQSETRGSVQPKQSSRKQKSNNEFKVNLKQVHTVLENATKDNLVELRDIWNDLIHSLSTSSRAILNNSKPVAASPEGLVVTFEFPILCEKAEEDAELKQGIMNFLDKVIGARPELVCIPESKWPTIRQNYIKTLNQPNHNQSTEQSKPEEKNEAVDTAVELFGEENITIKD